METQRLALHQGRAHKLALVPDAPQCFLSCGEDGAVSKSCTLPEIMRAVPRQAVRLNTSHTLEACTLPVGRYSRHLQEQLAAPCMDFGLSQMMAKAALSRGFAFSPCAGAALRPAGAVGAGAPAAGLPRRHRQSLSGEPVTMTHLARFSTCIVGVLSALCAGCRSASAVAEPQQHVSEKA